MTASARRSSSVRAVVIRLCQRALAGYAFAVVAVAVAFGVRLLLVPVTGTGAPFVLFFAAITVVSLCAGVGPGLLALLISIPVAAPVFVVRAGYSLSQASVQSVLFAMDGVVVVYLTHAMMKSRRFAERTSRQLHRAKEAMEQAAARTRQLIELAPDAFYLADLDARLVDVNAAACQMLGYERDELVGKSVFDVLAPEEAARLERVRVELMSPGQADRGEWVHIRKDGTRIVVEVSSNILPGGRWQAFVRDITARRHLEDERQVVVSLIENSPDFVGIADPRGKPIYLNPAGRRMVGLAADFPVEQTEILDYYPPSVRPFAAEVIVKSMVEQGRWSGETYFRNWATEESIPVSDEHFMIRDATGTRVLGMGTVTRDISEARRIHDQLREAEERFRLAIDEAPIGMAIVALDGRFVRVNRSLCEIVGYTPAELTGLTFQAITHPDDLDSDVALAGQLVRGEISHYQLEKRYIRKDSSLVDIMLHASMVRSSDGSPLSYIVQIEDITERKRVESISHRLATIVRESNDAITTQDFSGKILTWNRSAERMYGYSEAEALAMNISAIVPERNADTLAYLDAIRRGEKVSSIEVKRRAKDGRILDVWLTTAPLIENGRPVAITTTERDITERKQREQQRLRDLDAMERLHRVASLFLGERAPEAILYEALDAAIAIAGADFGNIQILDPTTSDLEVVAYRGLPDSWLSYFSRVGKGHGACGTAMEAGHRVVVEDVTKDPIFVGTEALEVQLRAGIRAVQSTPLFSRAGEAIGMVSTHWKTPHRPSEQVLRLLDLLARQAADIIERVQTDTALRLSEAKSSGILSISADALISIDDEQRITMFNEGAEKIFGYSKSEALGAPLELLIPERLRAMHRQHVERFATGAVVARRMGERGAAIVGLRKNGEEFPADAAISKLQVDGRKILTVALRDVTEQKQREMEIQRAVQARDRVLGVVAHDLRNPLSAIIMQSKAMTRRGPEPERRNQKPTEVISRAAARMKRLIEDLLDVTRIESGKLPLERSPLAPGALVGEAADMQRALAASGSLDLQLDVSSELPELWGDRDRLLQVFENLIGNAIKFTGSGGSITVGATARDHEVVFSVKDTGCGITAENVPHVFDRFWQATAHTGRLGAGLGLPITKGIVEAHGGRIWVESKPGQGTRFFFSIPTGRPEGDRASYLVH